MVLFYTVNAIFDAAIATLKAVLYTLYTELIREFIRMNSLRKTIKMVQMGDSRL